MANSNNSVGPTIIPTSDTGFASAYPRPDGYSGHGHFASPVTYSLSGANGYIGDSEIVARADHVHPLNFSTAKPRPIGIPYNKSGTVGYEQEGGKDFGIYGTIGIPMYAGSSNPIHNSVTNSYALSNHVHPYGFCVPTSVTNSTRPYNTFPDGVESRFSSIVLTTNGTVTPVYDWLTVRPSGTDTTNKYGNSGVCPFPARLDHTHPLNVIDLHKTGAKVEDYVKPIIDTASFGTEDTYARVDHQHKYTFTNGPLATYNFLYESLPDGCSNYFDIEKYNGYYYGGLKSVGIVRNDVSIKNGWKGSLKFPASVDHTHPLNFIELHDLGATGNYVKNYVKPVSFDASKSASGYGASYGTSNYYARVDHTHPLPVDGLTSGTPATGATALSTRYYSSKITTTSKTPTILTALQSVNGNVVNRYVGDDLNDATFKQSWTRDSSSNTRGFKINVVSFVGTDAQRPILYFRELTFDKYGICRSVSAPLTNAIRL